ncbi:hypothetical protein LUZ60_006888 [Juncus effusus]|nr:hypothetical protein LUZ60_006888 [Juncus effusus]
MAKRKRKAPVDAGILQLVPLLAVTCAMGFDYYATVFVFLDRWIAGGVKSGGGLVHAGGFTWMAFMSFVSFFVAALSDPGSVPGSYVPETEDPQREGAKSKYCEKCCAYKPPRAHHCKTCKRCVLKMDHHCVWIGNCVGYANYKSFLIFVFHAAFASLYSFVIFWCDVLQTDHEFSLAYTKIFYIFSGFLLFFLTITTSTLLGWHIYLLIYNMTTIEFRGVQRDKWLAQKSGQKYRHRFDMGLINNLKQVLGPNVLKWFVPTDVGHLKDGTQFPVSNE